MHKPAILFLFMLSHAASHAIGNHPESSTCPADAPWYAVCTSSGHSLEGWTGNCYATREEAQKEAEQHGNDVHQGNMRWTGVSRIQGIKPPAFHE